MAKTPLTIVALDVSKPVPEPRGAEYKVMINPSEFNHQRSVCYSRRKVMGQVANPLRFSAMNPDTLSFSLVLDGTGVVPAAPGQEIDVSNQLKALTEVIYTYDGEYHQPNHLRVSWVNLVCDCRLQSFDTQYTLFKSNGAPLRAKVSMTLVGFATPDEEKVRANRSSPDLSHSVQVVEGDTLPLLCLRIYGDARYYPDVAAFNGLDGFRRLTPGAHLHFPPLR